MEDVGGSEKSRFLMRMYSVGLLGAGLVRLLGQQNSLDVGQNTTLSDRDAPDSNLFSSSSLRMAS